MRIYETYDFDDIERVITHPKYESVVRGWLNDRDFPLAGKIDPRDPDCLALDQFEQICSELQPGKNENPMFIVQVARMQERISELEKRIPPIPQKENTLLPSIRVPVEYPEAKRNPVKVVANQVLIDGALRNIKCPACDRKGLHYANHAHAQGWTDYDFIDCRFCKTNFRVKTCKHCRKEYIGSTEAHIALDEKAE